MIPARKIPIMEVKVDQLITMIQQYLIIVNNKHGTFYYKKH